MSDEHFEPEWGPLDDIREAKRRIFETAGFPPERHLYLPVDLHDLVTDAQLASAADEVERATGIRPTWAVFGERPARRIPPRNTPGTSSGEHTQGDL